MGRAIASGLNERLDDLGWQKIRLHCCRLYSAPRDVILRDMTNGTEGAKAAFVRDDARNAPPPPTTKEN